MTLRASDQDYTAPIFGYQIARCQRDHAIMPQYLVKRANVLALGVLMAILALVGAVTGERFNAPREDRRQSQHSYRVLGTTKDLALVLRDAERGQRVDVLTGRDAYLSPYDAAHTGWACSWARCKI